MKYLYTFLLGPFMLLLGGNAASQQVGIGEWRDHLPYDYSTNVEEFNAWMFCSTPYSMFYFDREYNTINRLSKVNGLSDLGVSDISLNQELKILVVGYENTNIDLITEDLSIINIPDIKRKEILGNKTINSILNYGKLAYLSCGFGIVVLNLEKMEIKDTYYIGPDGTSLNVLSMTHNDTSFFAATEDGIYYADIENPNLAFYGNWTKMETTPFPDGFTDLVHYFNGMLFINYTDPEDSEDDLFVLQDGLWRELEQGGTVKTFNIRTSGDKLIVSYSYWLQEYNSDLSQGLKVYTYAGVTPQPADGFIGTDGFYWIADRGKGLVKSWGGGFEQEFIKPSGAPSADVFDLAIRDGKMYMVPGGLTATWGNTWRAARMFSFIDEEWKTYDNYNSTGLDSLRDFVAVAIDPRNSDHIFSGSWNRGMAEFKDNSIVGILNSDNSSLMPNMIEGYPVVKVGGIAFDSDNNMWVTNSGAENILSVRLNDGTATGTWQSYNLGTNSTGIDIRKVIVDSWNQKWMLPRTTSSNPNYILVFNEKNATGDQYRGLKSGAGQGNLPGSNVFAIAEDLEGEIWAGTDEGIAVFYSPQDILTDQPSDAERILVDFGGYVQYLLETESVKAIAVDGGNRKWIGTERAGVFLLSADGTEQIHHFTEDDSPLFSNNITSIAINDETGEVFIGTAKGLISYKSDATPGDSTNSNVYAYPNPVRPGYGGPIAIKGLVKDAVVKITDVTGTLIYETRAEGGQAIWNGHNFDGRKASTGVYLVYISNDDGSEKMVTKILFVN